MILHVTEATYLNNYCIQLSFNNGQSGVVDLKNDLEGTVFQLLKDKSFFKKFKLDKELDTIVWPNGTDIAPEYLYFLAFKQKLELQEQFKKWGYIA